MNTAWTISAGVTWFPNTAFVTTSSMDSSAADPVPARGRRALVPRSLWLRAAGGRDSTEGLRGRFLTTHRTVLITCVFFFLEYLTNFVKEVKERNNRLYLIKKATWLLMLICQSGQVIISLITLELERQCKLQSVWRLFDVIYMLSLCSVFSFWNL